MTTQTALQSVSQTASRIGELRGRIARTAIHNLGGENTSAADDINSVVQTTDPETLMHADIIAKQMVTAGNAKTYWQVLRPETRQRVNELYARIGVAAAQNIKGFGEELINKI